MKRTTRATVLAVALLASAPLFAAGSGTSAAGTHASMPEPRMAAAQGDCSLPLLPSTGLSATPVGLLPKLGSTAADPTEVDLRLNQAASCVRPLGLWNDEPDVGASPNRGNSVTAMAAGTSTTLAWQSSILEGSSGSDSLSVVPANAGH